MSPEETLSQPDGSGTPGALGIPTASGIECPACGTQNTADSKFCRHCGHLLRSLASGAPVDPKKGVAATEYDDESEEDLTSPEKIDERRAHGLLDRALLLSERGDMGAAILACRQAIALDHNHADPYALLGTLLERNGDLRGAAAAYERVLEIAPDNELERDSLNRIKARLEKTPAFNFNPDELFGSDGADGAVTSTDEVAEGIDARLPPTSSSLQSVETPDSLDEASNEAHLIDFAPATAGAVASASLLETAPESEAAARGEMPVAPSPIPAPVGPPASTSPDSTPKIERRKGQRRQLNLPVATDRRTLPDRRATAAIGTTFSPSVWPSSTPRTATPSTASNLFTPAASQPLAPLDFSFSTAATPSTPLWARMMRSQSFFMRTLPLLAVGVLGLGFLGWARSQAVAIDAVNATSDPTLVAQAPDDVQFVQPAPNNNAPQTQINPPSGIAAPTPVVDGLSVSNATPVPAAPTNTNTSNSTPPSAPTTNTSNNRPSTPRSGGGTPGRSNPTFPLPIAPAPVPPAPVPSNGNSGNGGGALVLPPPQTNTGEQAQPRIRVGSGLNPGGSPQEGRIRITQGNLGSGGRAAAPAPPPRTGTVARGDERNAASAAATGDQDRVINSLTSAINASGGDQGYLLQQRAMAFMDRSDYSRAIDDFQSAINAYQQQIDRGENVAAAQAGLRSARSGLNLALSRR